MQYKYKGMTKEGKRVKGVIVASSFNEAKQILKLQGIFYELLEEGGGTHLLSGLKKRPMTGSLMSAFSKELASYIDSGMTIVTALKLMHNQHKGEKKYASFIEEIKKQVEEGKSLYVALNSQSVYELPEFSSQGEVKKQATNAMIYPSFIFIVAIGMTAFLITFVVPKITQIFADTGQKLPTITKVVLGMSDFFTHYWLHVIIGLIIIVALFQFSFSKIMSFRKSIDGLLLKIPTILP